jgi:hypothetical protein
MDRGRRVAADAGAESVEDQSMGASPVKRAGLPVVSYLKLFHKQVQRIKRLAIRSNATTTTTTMMIMSGPPKLKAAAIISSTPKRGYLALD